MVEQNQEQSKGKKQKSMLDLLLDEWGWNYIEFSRHLGISRSTLLKYRTGDRELRLNWQQIQKLELLLQQVGKNFNDLPPDWFRDVDQGEDDKYE